MVMVLKDALDPAAAVAMQSHAREILAILDGEDSTRRLLKRDADVRVQGLGELRGRLVVFSTSIEPCRACGQHVERGRVGIMYKHGRGLGALHVECEPTLLVNEQRVPLALYVERCENRLLAQAVRALRVGASAGITHDGVETKVTRIL
jgi:hypothetical protein